MLGRNCVETRMETLTDLPRRPVPQLVPSAFFAMMRRRASVLQTQNRGPGSSFDAFSLREPVSTSLENALGFLEA
jgi:hypothetical protein